MKNSLKPMATSDLVLRRNRLVLGVILACGMAAGCGPQGAQSPGSPISPFVPQTPKATTQSNLVGQWRTVLQGIPVTITIEANGQYMQVGRPPNGGTETAQGGPYSLVEPNTIVFTVTDWSPKVRMIYVPDPGPVPSVPNPVGPYPGPQGPQWQQEGMPRPPGSRYAYVFNGPNSMTLNNEAARESITFTRATQ